MSEQRDDGGSAFPTLTIYEGHNQDGKLVERFPETSGGMSLRDYFAAKALPQAIAQERDLRSTQIAPGDFRFDAIAAGAYKVADAMLEARKK